MLFWKIICGASVAQAISLNTGKAADVHYDSKDASFMQVNPLDPEGIHYTTAPVEQEAEEQRAKDLAITEKIDANVASAVTCNRAFMAIPTTLLFIWSFYLLANYHNGMVADDKGWKVAAIVSLALTGVAMVGVLASYFRGIIHRTNVYRQWSELFIQGFCLCGIVLVLFFGVAVLGFGFKINHEYSLIVPQNISIPNSTSIPVFDNVTNQTILENITTWINSTANVTVNFTADDNAGAILEYGTDIFGPCVGMAVVVAALMCCNCLCFKPTDEPEAMLQEQGAQPPMPAPVNAPEMRVVENESCCNPYASVMSMTRACGHNFVRWMDCGRQYPAEEGGCAVKTGNFLGGFISLLCCFFACALCRTCQIWPECMRSGQPEKPLEVADPLVDGAAEDLA